MEYAPKGSLLDYYKSTKMTQSEIKTLFKKVCLGVKHMHIKGYSHRDLKLENILIFEENNKIYPKISDFGFASYCFK
jgi:p21-activated kinase 1